MHAIHVQRGRPATTVWRTAAAVAAALMTSGAAVLLAEVVAVTDSRAVAAVLAVVLLALGGIAVGYTRWVRTCSVVIDPEEREP